MYADEIAALKENIVCWPTVVCLMAARYLVSECDAGRLDRHALPDWVVALAHEEDNDWECAISVALDDIKATEMEEDYARMHMHPRGQATTSFSFVMLILALVALAGFSLLTMHANQVADAVAALAPADNASAPMVDELQADVDYSLSHGYVRHGAEAIAAMTCFDKFGIYVDEHGIKQEWTKPSLNRTIRVCYNPDSKMWYIEVLEKIEDKLREKTTFAKDKMHNWTQVARYLANSGYIPPQ